MKQYLKKTKLSPDTIIMIVTSIISLIFLIIFILEINKPESFVFGDEFQKYLYVFILAFAITSFISFRDFALALLAKGKYENKDWHLNAKAIKLIQKFLFLIISVLLITVILEITYDFQDKADELHHYIYEYEKFLDDENYEVKLYEHHYYFSNKQYYFWKQDTMYVDDRFTEEFVTVYKQLQAQVELDFHNFIQIDFGRFFIILNEDIYYVVQMLTTLGYGDITPNLPIGMTITWVAVLSAQFITIIGVILIIRDK